MDWENDRIGITNPFVARGLQNNLAHWHENSPLCFHRGLLKIQTIF